MKRQRNVILVACLLGNSFGMPRAVAEDGGQVPEASSDRQQVALTIDYGDGVQKVFTALPWSDSMTVGTALQLADRHPRGIQYQQRGRGSTAFLTQIDDLKNEGGRGRNWIYQVNGEAGDRSFAVRRLQAGDRVLWRFEKYRFR